jgi:hypothetical protein
VVEAARPKESPLHGSFTWDDTKAAQQWRIQQARQLIRAVVQFEQVNGKQTECRVFVSLTPDRETEGGRYRLANTVLSNEDQRRQLLADARAEMLRFRQKFHHLSELAGVFAAMDDVLPLEDQSNEESESAAQSA